MAQDLTNFDKALKEFYLPSVLSTIRTKRVLQEHIDRDTTKTSVSGREAVVPVNIRGSQAMGARSDANWNTSVSATGTNALTTANELPTPQQQTYVSSTIKYAFNYATIRFSHPTIKASRNDQGSFLRVAASEMAGIERDWKNDKNRQLFGTGFGVLGQKDATDINGSGVVTLWPGHQLKVGMFVDIHKGVVSHVFMGAANTGTLLYSGAYVSAVSGNNVTLLQGNKTTVLASPLTDSDNADADYACFTRHGAASLADNEGTSVGYEMMGLLGIVSDGVAVEGVPISDTFQGISRSANPEWQAQTILQNATNTTELMDAARSKADETADADTDLAVCGYSTWRKIGQLMTAQRRYSDTMKLKGGFTALNWGGIPIVADRDCPQLIHNTPANQDVMFWLDTSTIKQYQLADLAFDDEDGNVLHRRQDIPVYDATLFEYSNLGCTDPAKNTVVYGCG